MSGKPKTMDFASVGSMIGQREQIGPVFSTHFNGMRRRVCVVQCLACSRCSLVTVYAAGKTSRCRCVQSEIGRAAAARNSKTNIRHGASHSAEYTVWCGMRQRCENPNNLHYRNYGGRGISVCDRWKTFELFLEDMGKRPTSKHCLDRIDNDKGYEPGNVRWTERRVNQNNRRNTVYVTHLGVTRPLTEWAEICNLTPTALGNRIKNGWDLARAFSTPMMARGRRKA